MNRERNRNFIFDKRIPVSLRIIINTCCFFLDYVYKLLIQCLALFKRRHESKKYSVSLCAIFKDEELSLKEWIEFHKIIGVDHFYLYNNRSTDSFIQILEPYIKEGIVDLINWDYDPPCQFSAYQHCFEAFKEESQWIGFIDLDEFICPKFHDSISSFLMPFMKYPSVVVYWKMFGTSALLKHDSSKLIIEQYTSSWDRLYDVGKCFFNTNFQINRYDQHHVFSAKLQFQWFSIILPPINEFKNIILFKSNRLGLLRNVSDCTIQINHYVSKDYVSCVYNKFMLRGDVNNHERNSYTFYWHESKNTSVDYTIWRFIIQLKLALGYLDDQPTLALFGKHTRRKTKNIT